MARSPREFSGAAGFEFDWSVVVNPFVMLSAKPIDIQAPMIIVAGMMGDQTGSTFAGLCLTHVRFDKISVCDRALNSATGSNFFRIPFLVALNRGRVLGAYPISSSIDPRASLSSEMLWVSSASGPSPCVDLVTMLDETLTQAIGVAALASIASPFARSRALFEIAKRFCGPALAALTNFGEGVGSNKNGRPDFFGPAMGAVSFEHVS